jgi:FkbM family methyltransferase
MIQRLFTLAIKPFVGSGIGRIKILAKLYQKMATKILPQEKIITVQGFKMKVITEGRVNDIATELLFKGIHEPMSTKIFQRLVNEGDVVVDVGANVGYFSLLAAKRAGIVYSFEPDPFNMRSFVDNIALNKFKNIMPFMVALSDYSGGASFFTSSTESARHSLIKTQEHDGKITVKVDKLDDIVKCAVDFLKSDTEGNELSVLKGAKGTIDASPHIKILVEVNAEALQAQNVSIADLWNYLTIDLNMKYVFMVDDYKSKVSRTTLHQLLKYLKGTKLGCNLLCGRESLRI